ncbi:hypothetical protein AB0O34_18270 [Sphaerisporangium sp. NPDC088356]|uniref:hypothetical protein n=1 Tax=Sphaerisporangium sp. NPDC088356 TaxID=3154871 RepID=UPI00344585C8
MPGTPMDGLVIEPCGTAPEAGPPAEGQAGAGRPGALGGGVPWGGATTPDGEEGHAVTGRPEAPTPGGPSGAPWGHAVPGPPGAGPFWDPPFPGPPDAGPDGARAGSGAGAIPQVSQ